MNSFDRLMNESLQALESPQDLLQERATLSGTVDAFAQTNRFTTRTRASGRVYEVEVSNRMGDVGIIEIDLIRGQASYLDRNGRVVKTERVSRAPTSKQIKDHYVPQLLINTQTDDMFG